MTLPAPEPLMNVLERELRLTADEWSELTIDPVKDKRYQRMTVMGPLIADYLVWKVDEDGAAERTIDSYERDLAALALRFPKKWPADLTKEDLMRARGSFPPGSRSRVHSAWANFYSWLYEIVESIDADPMARLRPPKRRRAPAVEVFSDAEQAAMLTSAPTIRDKVGVHLVFKGLRRSEIVGYSNEGRRLFQGLRVADIDLVEKWIVIRSAKGGKFRIVAIEGGIIRALEEFMLIPISKIRVTDKGPRAGFEEDRAPQPSDFLLYQVGGGPYGVTWSDPTKPVDLTGWYRWWEKMCRLAGVRYRKPHAGRHTYGTQLVRQRELVAAQRQLGHASIRTTVDLYGHFDVSDQRRGEEALIDALAKGSGQ